MFRVAAFSGLASTGCEYFSLLSLRCKVVDASSPIGEVPLHLNGEVLLRDRERRSRTRGR